MEAQSRPSKTPLPELFDKALAVGGYTHTRQDIAEGVRSGRYQYWGDAECAVVTEIHQYPRTRKLHVFLAAGNQAKIIARHLPLLRVFAQDNGCTSITCTARKGFLRTLPKHGFTPKCVTFELELGANDV